MTTQTFDLITDAELQAASGAGLIDGLNALLPNPGEDVKDLIAGAKSGDGKQTTAAAMRLISAANPLGPMSTFSHGMAFEANR